MRPKGGLQHSRAWAAAVTASTATAPRPRSTPRHALAACLCGLPSLARRHRGTRARTRRCHCLPGPPLSVARLAARLGAPQAPPRPRPYRDNAVRRRVIQVNQAAGARGGRGGWRVVVRGDRAARGELGPTSRRCSRSTNAQIESDDGAPRADRCKPRNKPVCLPMLTHARAHTRTRVLANKNVAHVRM